MVGQFIVDYDIPLYFKSLNLRYSNLASADSRCLLWKYRELETHFVLLVLQVAGGRQKSNLILRDDYPVAD